MSSEKIRVALTGTQIELAMNVLADTARRWEADADRGPNDGLTYRGRAEMKLAQQMREIHAELYEAQFRATLAGARGCR